MGGQEKHSNIFQVGLRWVYIVYAIIIAVCSLILVIPLFVISDILRKPKWGLVINHYWARVLLFVLGIPMDVTGKAGLDKHTNYIFCPNHFSFLDIAILAVVPMTFKFVGKVSIVKVPLLGYVFRKFHITIDRSKMRERYIAYTKSMKALVDGFSLAIFPEGGITSTQPPAMGRFKEGPFRMAIETGTHLVPITLADSWQIFPCQKGKMSFNRRRCRVVIHEPIDPSKYTSDTLKEFQQDVYELIQKELNHLNQLV